MRPKAVRRNPMLTLTKNVESNIWEYVPSSEARTPVVTYTFAFLDDPSGEFEAYDADEIDEVDENEE